MVIPNIVHVEVPPLITLVSATRIGAEDKGQNDMRFRELANKLEKSGIPWLWLCFSNRPLNNMPSHFINMSPEVNIQNYIKKATYLVQLSTAESFSYSIVEALLNKTPVICCPMPVLSEIGVVDGENAHVIPYDMDFDVNILLDVPEFDYTYDNKPIIKSWEKIFAKPKSTKKKDYVVVEVLRKYKDLKLQRMVDKGTQMTVTKERAQELLSNPHNLVRIIGG